MIIEDLIYSEISSTIKIGILIEIFNEYPSNNIHISSRESILYITSHSTLVFFNNISNRIYDEMDGLEFNERIN